jgi:hypothetical protein
MSELNELAHRAIVENQPLSTSQPRSAGELAAAAFACFDDGVPASQIVTRLALPPEQLEALWRAWARFRGCVLLFPNTLTSLADAWRNARPMSASAVVETCVALGAGNPRMCRQCGTNWAEYCLSCPKDAARETARPSGRAKRQPQQSKHSRG